MKEERMNSYQDKIRNFSIIAQGNNDKIANQQVDL